MTEQTQSSSIIQWRTLTKIVLGLLIIGALLLTDLHFRGLVWRFFWSQTGEETIVGQVQGMVEVSGNLIRPAPQVAADVPILHTDVYPYGINTFFEQETEADKLVVQFQMIAQAGFGWIRQEFPWEDLEIDGRGQFTDSREDINGDGVRDTVSAWDKYDAIVDLADAHDLQMIVRLSNPPAWSRADNPETRGGALAPPDDYQDFVNYVVAVAERYQGRIRYYQVWNEPNIYPEWGENFISPADYTRLLCLSYQALKAVDPDIVVISGTIAPTNSIDGYQGYHDLLFIQAMYDAGAGDCFDVLSAQGYGLNSGSTDHRRSVTYLSVARHVLYRDLMVANGDAHKPIWLSEMGWSPMLEPCLQTGECLNTDDISQAFQFGAVTNEQAAHYLTGAYERARQDWPWIGHISYWHFTRPSIEQANDVMYWFRMVEADYSPERPTFTPLPVYQEAQRYLASLQDQATLYAGVHQAQSWEIQAQDSQLVTDAAAQFSDALQTSAVNFWAQGSQVIVSIHNPDPVQVMRDDQVLMTIPARDTWQTVTLASQWINVEQHYQLQSDSAFLLDSVQVRAAPYFAYGIGLGLAIVLLAGSLYALKLVRTSEPSA